MIDAQEQKIREILLDSKAQSPDKYFETSIGYTRGLDNTKAQPYNYSAGLNKFRGWVYAAANVNAKRAASFPIRMFAKKKAGKKFLFPTKKLSLQKQKYLSGDLEEMPSSSVLCKSNSFVGGYEEVIDHPILNLLKQVNPFQNGYDFAYQRFIYLELVGNSYYHIITDSRGIPQQLWTLPAQWMTIKPSATQFIASYLYGQDSTKQLELDIDEVIHLKYPNPTNLYYGLGKVEAAWSVTNINEYQHNFRQKLFQNNARPDYAVIMKGLSNTQEGMQRYTKYLEGMLQGYSNSGKFITLPGDIDIKPLTFSPKDLGNDDGAIIEEIAAVFGTPISKLKMNDANYSNAREGNISWLRDTIQPMLRMDEETLNQELLSLYGIEEDSFLAYDNPVPADAELELKKVTQLTTYGIVSPNEARASQGLPPIEGYDNLHYQGVQLNQPQPQPTPEPTPEPTKTITQEKVVSEEDTQAMIDKALEAYTKTKEEVVAKEEVVEIEETKMGKFLSKYIDNNDEHLKTLDEEENLVTNFAKVFTGYFEKQKQAVIEYVEKTQKSVSEDLEQLLIVYNEDLIKELKPQFTPIISAGAREALKSISVSPDVFDVTNPEVVKYIDNKTIKLVGSVSDQTIKSITQDLKTGIEAGDSPQQLTSRIQESSSFSKTRSEMIARTESADAFVEGEIKAWEQTEQVASVSWVLSPGACEHCKAIASQVATVPLGDNFVGKGEKFNGIEYSFKDIKGPSLHPRCRCDLKANLKD